MAGNERLQLKGFFVRFQMTRPGNQYGMKHTPSKLESIDQIFPFFIRKKREISSQISARPHPPLGGHGLHRLVVRVPFPPGKANALPLPRGQRTGPLSLLRFSFRGKSELVFLRRGPFSWTGEPLKSTPAPAYFKKGEGGQGPFFLAKKTPPIVYSPEGGNIEFKP